MGRFCSGAKGGRFYFNVSKNVNIGGKMNYSEFDIGRVANIARQTLFTENYFEVVSQIIRQSDSTVNPRFRISDNDGKKYRYLRDCMELPLRKFATPKTPKIFEIGPCFRQGEEDEIHRQEFFMLELYSIGQGLDEMKNITINIVNGVLKEKVSTENISIRDIITEEFDIDIRNVTTTSLINSISAKYPSIGGGGKLDHQIVNDYIEVIEKRICTKNYTLYFLTEYPMCTIDSAERINGTNTIHRFEAFIKGFEIAHAFVDCLDVIDIRRRINEGKTGDDEKTELVKLMENNSLQATVGLGIGIERLCMMQSDLTTACH
jgi:elongation factor P--beta-lysine ligase